MTDERVKEQVGVATPVETTDRGLFDSIKNDSENEKPVREDTFASESDQKAQLVSEPVEYKDEDEKKHGTVVEMLRSYSSNSSYSDEEGDDEETKQRKKEKKEKKGLTEKLMEKPLPGHKDEVEEETHVQEAVYSEPPHQEEVPEKKSFLNKIKEKLPGGHNKTDDHHHDEAIPVSAKSRVEVVYSEPPHQDEDPEKKSFLDKIKEKLPGHSKTDDSHDETVQVAVEPVVERKEEDKKVPRIRRRSLG
ncbi:hypothetical protein KSS87_019205 [Heliosperma pusillum]|nr:hypothetical protein KSS87_019205 [Heliosperma pusillum]